MRPDHKTSHIYEGRHLIECTLPPPVILPDPPKTVALIVWNEFIMTVKIDSTSPCVLVCSGIRVTPSKDHSWDSVGDDIF